MKKSSIFILALALIFTVSCKKETKETPIDNETKTEATTPNNESNKDVSKASSHNEVKKVTVALQSKNNSNVSGNAIFKQEKGIVSMIAIVTGLDEGEHIIHLGDKTDCDSNKIRTEGNIGIITANEKGQGTINYTTNEWCIGCEDSSKDILSKAIIVYQGSDNASGASKGSVNSCGIIQ
jgi:Cu-Zn family superoxide dismutase